MTRNSILSLSFQMPNLRPAVHVPPPRRQSVVCGRGGRFADLVPMSRSTVTPLTPTMSVADPTPSRNVATTSAQQPALCGRPLSAAAQDATSWQTPTLRLLTGWTSRQLLHCTPIQLSRSTSRRQPRQRLLLRWIPLQPANDSESAPCLHVLQVLPDHPT